eukprot:CAMPEP_0184483918 /NCGR_PEP_ID=MMETSP0113_2-20130426/5601_1 /TAXON_ID=91329 /ORGANISM="Norrisiella sphaerica, Strain BC52" /LENGTH=82 /DNA_ID=CAMNT_0026864595 /DNA_START=534 /DNA_END=779 /DNA_ORIENTATION=+
MDQTQKSASRSGQHVRQRVEAQSPVGIQQPPHQSRRIGDHPDNSPNPSGQIHNPRPGPGARFGGNGSTGNSGGGNTLTGGGN